MINFIVGSLILLIFGYIAYRGIMNMKNGKKGCHSSGCSGCSSSSGCPVMDGYKKSD
ncbi:FeoB-associated Cys-rich membrane protein [Vallitalea okinawensis]|uniref:FeoB-associated Cys-rich membrane protein n=1 Tax=Vallitalea okinawensis TaxID=2078660 RepID=UPI000CFDF5E4|nr:FeoB-associated Cys-rich membrane protein [Vallitalea okinawensis]